MARLGGGQGPGKGEDGSGGLMIGRFPTGAAMG